MSGISGASACCVAAGVTAVAAHKNAIASGARPLFIVEVRIASLLTAGFTAPRAALRRALRRPGHPCAQNRKSGMVGQNVVGSIDIGGLRLDDKKPQTHTKLKR